MNVTPDLEFSKVLALEVMDETELALYGEFLEMCKSGCNFDQIAQLMGEETCRAVLAAMKPG
jgi:hypothetical protein